MADERSECETDDPDADTDAGADADIDSQGNGADDNGPDRELLAWLAGRDVSCPACRYNLRGLRVDRCPECGIAFELGLKASTPGFKAWVISLIATSMGVGISLMFIFFAFLSIIVVGMLLTAERIIGAVSALNFIAGFVYLVMLVRQRARIWQRPTRELAFHLAASVVIALVPLVMVVIVVFVM